MVFQDLAQIGLVLFAGLELVATGLHVVIELGQGHLAFLADLVELFTLGVEAAFLHQQLGLLQGDFLFDIGQLAQGLVEILQLLQAGLAQVVVIGQGAGEFFRFCWLSSSLRYSWRPFW